MNEFKNLVAENRIGTSVLDWITEYLPDASYPETTIDEEIARAFNGQLWEDIRIVRGQINTEPEQWQAFPFLLSGGGRAVKLYQQFRTSLNANRNFHVNLNQIELEKPSALHAPGLRAADYHRLSVAYGLSFSDVGEIVTPDKIRNLYLGERETRQEDVGPMCRFDS